MIICKNLDISEPIRTTIEWFEKCPPQGKEKHWVDGRSAKETAILWLKGIPSEFTDIMQSLNFIPYQCSPEFRTRFDTYKGNTRNHDLLVINEDRSITVCIESKVDEPFGDYLNKAIVKAEKKKLLKPDSKALSRIEELRNAVFGSISDNQLNLRYQLLHGVAATLAEARTLKSTKAVFIVQTIITSKFIANKSKLNQLDLDNFVNYLSNGKQKTINDGVLLKIGTVPGSIDTSSKYAIPNNIELYIGKFSIRI